MRHWPMRSISLRVAALRRLASTEADLLRRTIFLLIVLLAQAACIPIGDAWIQFSGHVRDTSGRPIQGVLITILIDGKAEDPHCRPTSDQYGAYEISRSVCPCDFDFEVIVSKEGFVAFSKKARAHEAFTLRTLDIVLEREPRYESSAQPSKGASANP